MTVYPWAFEHSQRVARAEQAPLRQVRIGQGNDSDAGAIAWCEHAGRRAEDRGSGLVGAGHARKSPVRPVAKWRIEADRGGAAAVGSGGQREVQADSQPGVAGAVVCWH